MPTMASKNSAANGSDRASAWIGKTPSSTPASRMRWRFSVALNDRSVAQTRTADSWRGTEARASGWGRGAGGGRGGGAGAHPRRAGRRARRGAPPPGQPRGFGPAADAGEDPLGVIPRRAGKPLGDEPVVHGYAPLLG